LAIIGFPYIPSPLGERARGIREDAKTKGNYYILEQGSYL